MTVSTKLKNRNSHVIHFGCFDQTQNLRDQKKLDNFLTTKKKSENLRDQKKLDNFLTTFFKKKFETKKKLENFLTKFFKKTETKKLDNFLTKYFCDQKNLPYILRQNCMYNACFYLP